MSPRDLDARMRTHEAASDRRAADGRFLVARLGGRGFSRLNKVRREEFDRPFDLRFRDAMIATAEHLMRGGLAVAHGHTHSDEISLLLRHDEAGERRPARIAALLAGEASAKFSLLLGELAAFTCGVVELDDLDAVVDHFRWRRAEAEARALAAHCQAALLRSGVAEADVEARLAELDHAGRIALLVGVGVDFARLPAWQRRGVGLRREAGGADSHPLLRNRIKIELELPAPEIHDLELRELSAAAANPEA